MTVSELDALLRASSGRGTKRAAPAPLPVAPAATKPVPPPAPAPVVDVLFDVDSLPPRECHNVPIHGPIKVPPPADDSLRNKFSQHQDNTMNPQKQLESMLKSAFLAGVKHAEEATAKDTPPPSIPAKPALQPPKQSPAAAQPAAGGLAAQIRAHMGGGQAPAAAAPAVKGASTISRPVGGGVGNVASQGHQAVANAADLQAFEQGAMRIYKQAGIPEHQARAMFQRELAAQQPAR